MGVEDLWRPNKQTKNEAVFGGDAKHPAIDNLTGTTKNSCTRRRTDAQPDAPRAPS